MNKQHTSQEQSSFIFNIEVLIEDNHHATALEQLLHSLNGCGFLDYRILSGIQLGQLIDKHKADPSSIHTVPIESVTAASSTSDPDTISNTDSNPATEAIDGFENIRTFMKNNSLIRLIVNRGLGIILNIPCRIINIDEHDHLITVYHVDEKQVYTFRLNEIEDFIE